MSGCYAFFVLSLSEREREKTRRTGTGAHLWNAIFQFSIAECSSKQVVKHIKLCPAYKL